MGRKHRGFSGSEVLLSTVSLCDFTVSLLIGVAVVQEPPSSGLSNASYRKGFSFSCSLEVAGLVPVESAFGKRVDGVAWLALESEEELLTRFAGFRPEPVQDLFVDCVVSTAVTAVLLVAAACSMKMQSR